MALVYPISQFYLCTELKNFILMDSTDCFLEILSAYQSSDSGCQVSLLEYCHRFGVDYYKFLGWYRHYKCQLTNPTSPSGMQLTPIHVNGSPSGHSRCTLSPKSVKSDNFEIVSFRLKLGNGVEIRKCNTNLESITALLQNLGTLC